MSSPFVAEIRMFGGNFAPTGWATCDGQLMPISQNTALFSLLGTFYGGDGKSTFALPNLQGSAPIFWGQGSGLSLYDLGQSGGTENVTLLTSEMPVHSHSLMGHMLDNADLLTPTSGSVLAKANPGFAYGAAGNLVQMSTSALTTSGASLPHNNMQPFLTVTF